MVRSLGLGQDASWIITVNYAIRRLRECGRSSGLFCVAFGWRLRCEVSMANPKMSPRAIASIGKPGTGGKLNCELYEATY